VKDEPPYHAYTADLGEFWTPEASEKVEEKVKEKDKKEAEDPAEKSKRRFESHWVTTVWPLILTVEKEGTHIKQRTSFQEWCRFLDLVCGSKRPATGPRINPGDFLGFEEDIKHDDLKEGEGESEKSMVAPIEDVEDAIIAALHLNNK
jgi:hypothetical protein